ncbi:MAG: hypothetical protein A2Y16_00310 [Tenericutes bacterium GWF2_57_13]|nr:MAG: hypothetical protein A2Y16_00310 [Tenericutes bacterium GWF2_57_13]
MHPKHLLTLSLLILFFLAGCTAVTTTTTASTTAATTGAATTNQTTTVPTTLPTETTTTETTTAAPVDGIAAVTGLEDAVVIRNHYFHVLKGVAATSDEGVDLTPYIKILGSVDFGTLGTYELQYELAYGEDVFSTTRTVVVTDGTYVAPTGSRPAASATTVVIGEGSYRSGTASSITHPVNPAYIEADLLSRAIPSNGWWTTLLVNNYGGTGNGIYTNPLKSGFANQGVEITNPGEGFVQYWNPEGLKTMAQFSLSLKDLYLRTDGLAAGYMTRVIDYGASSVKVAMRNVSSTEDEMVVTYAQGSPYIFAEVASRQGITLTAGSDGVDNYEYYDLSGNRITDSSYLGDAIIVKMVRRHVGYVCTPPANVGSPIYADRYFLVNAPTDTVFTIGSGNHPFGLLNRLSMTLGEGNYLSIAAIPSLAEAGFYHDHGYAFIAGSTIDYDVDHANSIVSTDYLMNVQNVSGIVAEPALALLPHQYRNSEVPLTTHTFRTVRGTLKVMAGSAFSTVLPFHGMLPGFTLPEDATFSAATVASYLADLDSRTEIADTENFLNAEGPYWNSKALYPLAQGTIIADQIGDATLRDGFIAKLEYLLEDWFTYDGDTDPKYLYYNRAWGSVYYSDNTFNTAGELSDHSFTHGYLVYAAAVVAMYDPAFIAAYGGMVDILLNDYMTPEKGDAYYAYLRSFDAWAGHSWAHGFGSFAEGNNLESTSEALNSWVAGYLWGLATGDEARVDAAIYGFVTETSAIKEYWFDYEEENWADGYANYAAVAGMVWGGKYDYATWFGANPTFIYGIQWLPAGEFLTNYALDETETERLTTIFETYLAAKNGVIDTWYSNMWSVLAIYNPEAALAAFDANKILTDDYPSELAGAYWMIHALATLDRRTVEITMEIHPRVASSLYVQSDGSVVAMVWNPGGASETVRFFDGETLVSTATVDAHSFTKVTVLPGV